MKNQLQEFLAMIITTNSEGSGDVHVDFENGIQFLFDKHGTIKHMYNDRPAVKK